MSSQKRKVGAGAQEHISHPKKRIRKQKDYHSSSDESYTSEQDFTPVNLQDSEDEADGQASNSPSNFEPASQGISGRGDEEEAVDEGSTGTVSSGDESDQEYDGESCITSKRRHISKRNDPEAFSTSIAKILSTKLSKATRQDPLLSRSREASNLGNARANEKLERQVKAKMRAERKEELERGRIKDVLGLESGTAGELAEEEKRLRKIAQRGVVKLFNAVRAAQVKGEEAAREERRKGTIGMANREEKVNEMSKQGFLELINGKNSGKAVEEA